MNKGIQIAIIVVCLGGASFLIYRQLTRERPGSQEGVRASFYLCTNPECGHEYAVEPYQDLEGREPFECPECGEEAADAARCPSCERFHATEGHGRYQPECPHCGKDMPPLTEQLRNR